MCITKYICIPLVNPEFFLYTWFSPPNSEHLCIMNTLFGPKGVRYREVLLYTCNLIITPAKFNLPHSYRLRCQTHGNKS